jgi:transcriptional regulator with XRE-family HTH domain
MPRMKVNIVDARIGASIRRLRLSRRVSQSTLGSVIGVTWQQIQKYEKGENRIAALHLFQIAAQYGVPLEYFAPVRSNKLTASLDASAPEGEDDQALQFAQTRDGFALMRAFSMLDKETGRALIALARRLAKTYSR